MELILMGLMAIVSVIAAIIGTVMYVREQRAIVRNEEQVIKAKQELHAFYVSELQALKARVAALEAK